MKAPDSPKVNLFQKLRALVQWISNLEEMFVGDPDRSIKRITALEVELRALKSASPRNFRKDSPLDALF